MGVREVVNLLRGSAALEVTGQFPERFLNLCAQRGVAFWDVEQPDEHTLRLTVAWTDRGGLDELAARAGCVICQGERKGLPPFLLRFRKRYALLVGLALALAAVSVLSRFVLVIDVEGNARVPSATIHAALDRAGLRPGCYGPSLAAREIANTALLELPELSWMTVNLHGIRAEVLVRERVEPPEFDPQDDQRGDIVARAPGIVTALEVYAGDAAVDKGATVLPGDVLIRGSVELQPPPYSEDAPLYVPVRAMGQVEGRTWRTLQASIPLTAQVKVATGEEESRWSASFFSRRVNFYQNSGIPFTRYDKITKTWVLKLPGDLTLPFTLRREVCRAYDTVPAAVEPQAAQTMLEQQLTRRLAELLDGRGEVVSQSFSASEADGALTVTLSAECREELGTFRPQE